MSQYSYTKQVNLDILKQEIEASSITIALDGIDLQGVDDLTINFKASLSSGEETILDTIVDDHVYQQYTPQDPITVEVNNVEVDTEGRQITRVAAGKSGWTYMCHPIEFETANFYSLYSKDYLDVDRGDVTIKFYASNGTEITSPGILDANESNIVKTVVTWKPNFDYEIISGSIRQSSSPSTDVRVWTVGGIIDLGGAYVKEFTGGLNLRHVGADEEIKTDGRASKYMKKDIQGVPYQANQFQFIIRHNAGVQHKIMLLLEYFRA